MTAGGPEARSSRAGGGRGSRWAGRLLLVLGGVAVGLVLLEVALQIAAAVQRSSEPPSRFAWRGDGTRVLAVGDSNTYGLFVEPGEAYPVVFEQRWNERGGAPVDVMNLARPGMNSSQARALLDATLDDLRPDVLLLMIGANDFWTTDLTDSPIWARSRVLRLLAMLWVNATRSTAMMPDQRERIDVQGRAFELDIRANSEPVGGFQAKTRANLRAIVERARAAGTEVVLLTYPADDDVYLATNMRLRQFARAEGVRMVDMGLALRRLCPAMPPPDPNCRSEACRPERPKFTGTHSRCDMLFGDGHPTAAGHAVVGEQLFEAYRQLRLERGGG